MCLNKKQVLGVSAAVFTLVSLFHAVRLLAGWRVQLGPYEIPLWVSGFGLVVAGYLAYRMWGFASAEKSKKK